MPYLREALNSVLEQDYPHLEILIADDDSTDGSYEFALEQAAADERIHVLRLEPKKNAERRTAAALNKGLDQAKGIYIAMMDADDWCDRFKISKQVAFMQQHPHMIACGTQAKVKWEGAFWKKNTTVKLPLTASELKIYLLRQSPFLQNAVMIRKDCIDRHQLRYAESMHYAEDYEFFSRLIRLGEIANMNEFLVTYRMHQRQSIRHPDFSSYVKVTVKKNIREAFHVSEEEAEQHWNFVNHRNGYEVHELKALYAWKERLTGLNDQQHVYDKSLFRAFVDNTWKRRVQFNTNYSLSLLLNMIRQPYRGYWKGISLYCRCVFVLKCFVGKKQ